MIYRVWRKLMSWPRELKWFWQRGRRGWADCDWWDIDSYLTRILIPMLLELKTKTHGYPACDGINNPDDWEAILDKIIRGFQAGERLIELANWQGNEGNEMRVLPDGELQFTRPWSEEQVAGFKAMDDKDDATFNEGMTLFGKYFFNLWD